MAINKRKDAAALFELIDKSTLKVPKHTGSLKIPSWWSSKSNPPAPNAAHGTNGNGAHTATAKAASNGIAAASAAPVVENDAAPPPQARLFEPPASAMPDAVSPSIRPPPSGRAIPVSRIMPAMDAAPRPAKEPPAHENGAAKAARPRDLPAIAAIAQQDLPLPSDKDAGEPAGEAHEGYAGSGSGRRVFAPQTMSQGEGLRGDPAAAQKFRLARSPMWILVTGGAAAVIVVVLIGYGLIRLFSGHKVEPPRSASTIILPQNPTIPAPRPAPSQAAPGAAVMRNVPGPVNLPPQQGQVFNPGTVARSPNLYYIMIASTRTASIAQDNAKLLADNGVDVSIETQMGRANGKDVMWYKLFSVKGLPTLTEAEPLRLRIVAIGRLHRDFVRTRKGAWDDARAIKWSAVVGTRG